MRSLRFGLVGTGYWARSAHAPALSATEGIEFTAIWGRDQRAAGDIAGRYGVSPYQDFDAFLADVDAVAFAVPPDVQSAMAVRAAESGKHLLLEKPLALTAADADAVANAAEAAGVAALVFFTSLFLADVRTWLADVAKAGGWVGGSAFWLGDSLSQDNPFNTPWRRDKGGLWDLSPHLIALLWTSLGPVTSVTADVGHDDVVHLVLHHSSEASSVLTVTLTAQDAAEIAEVLLWGSAGRSAPPRVYVSGDAVVALRTALQELAECVRSGKFDHQCDVRFGRDVTLVVADAQAQITARRRG